MAAETLTFTLDTGNGETGDVVIRLRPDLAPGHIVVSAAVILGFAVARD